MKEILVLLVLIVVTGSGALSDDVIPIVKAGTSKKSLDLAGLTASGRAAEQFKSVLKNDLERSGWFTVTETGRGGVVVKGAAIEGGGRVSVACNVGSPVVGLTYLDQRYADSVAAARTLAHQVADEIIFKVTGRKGIASTRIVFVGKMAGNRKDIYLCDADGANPMRLTRDGAPIIRPRWTPDASRIVYTSLRTGWADVYVLNLAGSSWKRVAAFEGSSVGSSVSPDGSRIALTLSKDGNPELYTMSINGGGLTRLTRTPNSNEASPSWSPDGDKLVFVANTFASRRAGRPNLFVMSAGAGRPDPLGRAGSENVSPDWGSDGRIVFSSSRQGRYQICIYDPRTKTDVQITEDGYDYEDPSWAPDNRHIACTRTGGYKSDIYILDSEKQDDPMRLTTAQGEWYSPAWSPK